MGAVRIAVAAALCGLMLVGQAHAERDTRDDFLPGVFGGRLQQSKKRQIQLVPAAPKPDPDAAHKRQVDASLYAPHKKPFEAEDPFQPQIVPLSGYPAVTI